MQRNTKRPKKSSLHFDSADEDSYPSSSSEGGEKSDYDEQNSNFDASSDVGREENSDLQAIQKTKRHLSKILKAKSERQRAGILDAAELDREIVATRYAKTAESASSDESEVEQPVRVHFTDIKHVCSKRGSGHPMTAIVVGKHKHKGVLLAFTSEKSTPQILQWECVADGQWRVKRRMRFADTKRRTSILCLALSRDTSTLVSGHADGTMTVWDVASGKERHQFEGPNCHRDAVLSLAFEAKPSASGNRLGERSSRAEDLHGTLYSSSADRTVRLWTVAADGPAMLDCLYGHQDAVPSVVPLPAAASQTCVSVGGLDGSVRLWRVSEESQLLFKPSAAASGGTQDLLVAVLGGDERACWATASLALSSTEASSVSAISLWVSHRKKPVAVSEPLDSPVTAMLACAAASNRLISAHVDGSLRIWQVSAEQRLIQCERTIEKCFFGVPNAMALCGDTLLVACGMETRLGRSLVIRRGVHAIPSRSQCNRLCIFALLS